MRHRLTFTALAFGVCLAETNTPIATADEACGGFAREVQQQIESDYVGFAIAVAPDKARLQAWHEFASARIAEAESQDQTGCTYIAQSLTSWFDDPHLFLIEDIEVPASETEALRAAAPVRDVASLPAPAADDPLAGDWVMEQIGITIAPEPASEPHSWIAVVTSSGDDAWKPGDVIATFAMRDGVLWATLRRGADRAEVRRRAVLQRNGLFLHMAPQTWARRTPDAAFPAYDPADPRAPLFADLGNGALLVSFASMDPRHAGALSALVSEHAAAIAQCRLLIIDLRANEGGSSGMASPLLPFIMSQELEPPLAVPGYPMVLSSPTMRKYYQTLRDQFPAGPDRDMMDEFLSRLEAAPGALVPWFLDRDMAAGIMASPPVAPLEGGPSAIAILTDEDTVSAAEAFRLFAGRSTRATVFGAPTGGSIDFQNVVMIEVGEGRLRHLIGLPTMAWSDEVATRGLNANGVPVDVPLPAGGDWISLVLAHYGIGG